MFQPTEAKKYRVVHVTSAHPVMDIRIFYKECRSLARAGFDVIQICNHDLNDTIDGVRIIGLGKNKGRASRFTKGAIKTCVAALRCRGDLYHLHDPDILILGAVLRMLGKRVIYDIHEDLPTKVLLKMYLPKILRRPLSLIVGHLENIAARAMTGLITATPTLKTRFKRANRNIVVVNNFPMLEEFDNAEAVDWKGRERSAAYFGGISEARGVREMVCAINMLPTSLGVKLELAGWFYVRALLDQLKEDTQWNLVNWHNEVDRNGLRSLLRKVSVGLIVLHPEKSFVSSQPTKLFEYMAAGIPVVASDFPLWRSIVNASDCGILVNPLDATSIAAAIETLISNPECAQAMGQRGRRAVEEHFNWANEEQTLLSFYLQLLSNHTTKAKCNANGFCCV
jgi:glycosyltransferase involved in cell wall biosynthesis